MFTKEDTTENPSFLASECTSLEDITITGEIVKKALDSLKVTSSPGPDEIHPRVLKGAATQITKYIAILFHKYLDTGSLPEGWKLGRVVHIFKRGNRKAAIIM